MNEVLAKQEYFQAMFTLFFFFLFLDKDFVFHYDNKALLCSSPLHTSGDSKFTVLPGIHNKNLQSAWMHGAQYSKPMWRRNLAELLTCYIALQLSIMKSLPFPTPLEHQCEAESKMCLLSTTLFLFLLC